jgi:hypothetical protein
MAAHGIIPGATSADRRRFHAGKRHAHASGMQASRLALRREQGLSLEWEMQKRKFRRVGYRGPSPEPQAPPPTGRLANRLNLRRADSPETNEPPLAPRPAGIVARTIDMFGMSVRGPTRKNESVHGGWRSGSVPEEDWRRRGPTPSLGHPQNYRTNPILFRNGSVARTCKRPGKAARPDADESCPVADAITKRTHGRLGNRSGERPSAPPCRAGKL